MEKIDAVKVLRDAIQKQLDMVTFGDHPALKEALTLTERAATGAQADMSKSEPGIDTSGASVDLVNVADHAALPRAAPISEDTGKVCGGTGCRDLSCLACGGSGDAPALAASTAQASAGSIDTPELRELVDAYVRFFSTDEPPEMGEVYWKAIIAHIDARSASRNAGAVPRGFLFVQSNGHETYFNKDPKWARAEDWVSLGARVIDLFDVAAPVKGDSNE